MESSINLTAVLLAAAVALALKQIWYSSLLFKDQHIKLTKNHKHLIKKGDRKKSFFNIGIEYLLYIISAFVIYHLINLSGTFYYEFSPTTVGINTAFWVWVGFILPLQVNDMVARHHSWRLLVIDAGFRYFSLITMALIIARFAL